MPKSASMANQHGKVCAAAVIALIKGQPVNPNPVMMNTCYSFVSGKSAMHVTSVHQYDAERENAGRRSKAPAAYRTSRARSKATYAWGWARNIWADSLA